MMFNNPNGNSVSTCPVCLEDGILKFEVVVLKDKIFKRETRIDDCPLCDAFGYIEIIEDKRNEHRTRDNREGDIHPR